MSTSSNSYRLPPLGRPPDLARSLASANGAAAGLTINGCILFLTGLMVFLSAFISYRVEFGGLGVHPYLVPLGFAGCFVVVARLAEFPVAALVSLILFTALYCIATLAGPKAIQEIAKVVASAGTIVTVALLVRSEKDFRWGTLGLLLAVTALGIVGLFNKHESYTGVDPIQGSNENAFSLYTLAPMLLAG